MKRALLMIVVLVLIGCDKADGGGKSTTSNITNQVITPEDKKPKNTAGAFENYKPVELYLDDLTFEEAFEIENRAKGEGHTFWWNGEEYTTDLYVSVGNYQWVKNSNDLDDNCRTNMFDECGTCNGPGITTWYRDHDGDGLGDPKWSIEDCFYPSVDEE